jgi:hypothetical protein
MIVATLHSDNIPRADKESLLPLPEPPAMISQIESNIDFYPTVTSVQDAFADSFTDCRSGNPLSYDLDSSFAEWTPESERRFIRMAEKKAVGELSFKAKVEFERLSEIRRRLKNPRTGQEIIAEYEQRMLTRDLVAALEKYVSFHKSSNKSR